MIDLRSDTFTLPTQEMLEVMASANVGDDVFSEDASVNELEEYAASLFGKEAGLYCPSGTMTNQVAINVHTKPGDEVICDHQSHIYLYEGGGIAANSGASVSLLKGNRGRLNLEQIQRAVRADDPHFPKTRLVSLENTANKGGGSVYPGQMIRDISTYCREEGIAIHLDGARIFNAIVESDYNSIDIGNWFDSVSICLSKGLGAPVGSVLVGSKDFIHQARRVRKRFGGGMRQAGYTAAAGLYALKNHVDRLIDDHRHAKRIAAILQGQSYTKEVIEVQTNIVMLQLNDGISGPEFQDKLKERGILALALSPDSVRLVTHLGVSESQIDQLEELLNF